jgi:photosynthetic reaction center cytochrome c subunit
MVAEEAFGSVMKLRMLKLIVLGLSVAVLFVISNRHSQATASSIDYAKPQAQEKTVEQVQKNIKVLTGMPQSQLIPTMNYISASLGVRCNFCHVNKNGAWVFDADDKPEKATARTMIQMVLDLNKTMFKGETEVGCFTCHRGRSHPDSLPPLPLPQASPRPAPAAPAASPLPGAQASPAPTPAAPTADDILNKYIAALGGQAAVDKLKTMTMTGTYVGANGETIPYEVYLAAPDKFLIRATAADGVVERGFDGKVGWEKGSRGVSELPVATLNELKSFFSFYRNLRLKEQFTQLRVTGRDKIGDRAVVVVGGRTVDGRRERLFFDAETGLLLRRIRYTTTMIGVIPQQIDFDDYRDVEGVKLPFSARVSAVEINNAIATRKYTEIKLNAAVDDSKFAMPAAKPAVP